MSISTGVIVIGANVLEVVALSMQGGQTDGAWGAGSGSLAVQIVLLITTLSGFIYTLYRESRNRRWDLEDRERARKELAAKVEKVTETQATVASQHRDQIINTINENTQMNEAALNAANDVHRRIAEITRRFTEASSDAKDSTRISHD